MTAIIYKFPEREPIPEEEEEPIAPPVEEDTFSLAWFIIGGLFALII